MKCNSDYHAGICPSRRRNGDCISEYPCRHKIEPSEPKTNADHIRSMTDEELATFLAEVEYRRSIAGGGAIWLDSEGAMVWLKQPYKEDI